jgi:hypothetical protein
MQRTQCSVMQNRKDAWTLATQNWWTLSTHAVVFSASRSLTPTWSSILIKGLGRNQDATEPISPVGLFVLTYTCPFPGPQNCAEGERRIVNNILWLWQLVGGILPWIPVLDPRTLYCRTLCKVALVYGFFFSRTAVFSCRYHFTHVPYSYFIYPHCPTQCATHSSG